jgi:hypothetical protein
MVDALCLDDLDPYGREINDPLRELYSDLYHRLLEAPGSNIDDPDRGVGLFSLLSAGFDPATGPSQLVKNPIEADFRKDGRVQAVSASAALSADGTIAVSIQVVANFGVLGITATFDGQTIVVTPTPPAPYPS